MVRSGRHCRGRELEVRPERRLSEWDHSLPPLSESDPPSESASERVLRAGVVGRLTLRLNSSGTVTSPQRCCTVSGWWMAWRQVRAFRAMSSLTSVRFLSTYMRSSSVLLGTSLVELRRDSWESRDSTLNSVTEPTECIRAPPAKSSVCREVSRFSAPPARRLAARASRTAGLAVPPADGALAVTFSCRPTAAATTSCGACGIGRVDRG
mmetsp:Transcript_25615/g.74041  ORF Transcript_25615/g.74041 Transcript_25615/m.74041 type:complete len:209 (-) Transcript_25615:55-681(-)